MSMFATPAATEGGEFNLLEDGCYEAVVCGLRGFVGTKYQSDEPQDKIQVVFQVQDGDGIIHYLASKPMANFISDKSNLFKLLNGITGYDLEKFKDGFDLRVIVNADTPIKCQLAVKTVTSKKDPNKSFNEIDGYLKAKKNQKNAFIKDDKAPAWLNTNVKEVFWLPGLGFQASQAQATEPAQPAAPAQSQFMTHKPPTTPVSFAEFQANAARTPDEIPVAPFPTQPGPAQAAPSPYVAPQAKQVPAEEDLDTLPF